MDKDDDGKALDDGDGDGDGDGVGVGVGEGNGDDDGDGDGDGNEKGRIGTAMNESINRRPCRPRASLCRHAV